jgi:hypothetical protein
MSFDPKRKSITERIKHLEQAIVRANEYLESGKNANWQGFQPLFVEKLKEGKPLPPHKDWVKNVFLPQAERRLYQAEKVLERLDASTAKKR